MLVEAAKPVAAAQDLLSTFVVVTSLDIFRETLGQFAALFVVTRYRDISSCIEWRTKPVF